MPAAPSQTLRCALVLGLAGCTTGRAAPLEQDRNVVGGQELAVSRAGSTYEALRRLRPHFLHTCGPTSILLPVSNGPAVYVDHTLIGGLEVLADLPILEVAAIRFIGAWDATTRYGSRFPNGVIEVTTRIGR